jgi:hypothetical protein
MSQQLLGEVPDILIFEKEEVQETVLAAELRGRTSTNVSRLAEANINTLSVKPVLSVTAPRDSEDARSTRNCYKATFGHSASQNQVVVIILPFCVPDNVCHFAAQEASVCLDQINKPGTSDLIRNATVESV